MSVQSSKFRVDSSSSQFSSKFQFQVQSCEQQREVPIQVGLRDLGYLGQIVAWVAADGRLGIDRLAAIVNGTSNFLLTRLAEPGATFAAVLDEAQRAGYAEADPARDVDGLDAADKLVLLASLFGWGTLSRDALEVQGIGELTSHDVAAAGEIGGVIKPVVCATRGDDGVEAFVGPALLSSREPLAALDGALNGIRLDGKYVSNLFFSGPGAGPEVTAHPRKGLPRKILVSAPATPWFVRVTFRGVVPSDEAVRALIAAAGLEVEQVVRGCHGASRWLTAGSYTRLEIDAARERLRFTHRIESFAIRRMF